MKKLILILLTITLLSCNVSKIFNKNKITEENNKQTEVKIDSVAEVKAEKEIVSTFSTDTKTEYFDLSEVTIFEVMNDSGEVKERTTTIKNNIKGNVIAKGKEDKKETSAESTKVELSKVDKSKKSKSKIEVKKSKQIKKWSLPTWIWIILGITFFLFILVAVWKIKKKYFPL